MKTILISVKVPKIFQDMTREDYKILVEFSNYDFTKVVIGEAITEITPPTEEDSKQGYMQLSIDERPYYTDFKKGWDMCLAFIKSKELEP